MRKVLSKGRFNLTKCNSSCPVSLSSLEPKMRLHPENALPQNQKVLDLTWDAALDCNVIQSKLEELTKLENIVLRK